MLSVAQLYSVKRMDINMQMDDGLEMIRMEVVIAQLWDYTAIFLRDWRKPQKTSLSTTNVPAEIQTEHFRIRIKTITAAPAYLVKENYNM
jgi:hypothetical protein